MDCGSYNTVREKGPLVRRSNGSLVEEHFEPRLDHDAYGGVGGAEAAGGGGVNGAGALTPPETPTREQSSAAESTLSLGNQSLEVLNDQPRP